MKASDKCIEAIKAFEGFRPVAYRCPAGVLTIGYGHTKGVHQKMRISEARATELLREDLREVEREVSALGLPLTQGQFDALVDFTFNLGASKLRASTLLKKIKAGASVEEVQAEFRRWVYAGGKKMDGLVKRREWEAERWAS